MVGKIVGLTWGLTVGNKFGVGLGISVGGKLDKQIITQDVCSSTTVFVKI